MKRTDQALNLALTLCGRIQSLVSSLHSHGTYTVNSKAFFLRKWILVKFSLSNQVKRTDQALTLTLTLCGRIQSLVSSLHSHGTYTVNS